MLKKVKKQGLVTAYILDGNGGGRKIGWDEVLTWQPEQGKLWMHLDYTSKNVRAWLEKKSNLKKNVKQS